MGQLRYFMAAADYPTGQLARRCVAGELVAVARGRYAVSADPEKAWWVEGKRVAIARARAVAEATPSDAVIGYEHAALLHGGPYIGVPSRVEVISPRGYRNSPHSQHFRRHRRRLATRDIAVIDGIRVTSMARTLIDLARRPDTKVSLCFADFVFRTVARVSRFDAADGLARQERLRAILLQRLDEERGARGNRRARVIIEHANGLAESPLETLTRRALLILGVPMPTLQFHLHIDGENYYTDHAWTFAIAGRTQRIHIEADGNAKYTNKVDRERERERNSRIRALGDTLEHVTWAHANERDFWRLEKLVHRIFPAEVLRDRQPVRALMTPDEERFFASA